MSELILSVGPRNKRLVYIDGAFRGRIDDYNVGDKKDIMSNIQILPTNVGQPSTKLSNLLLALHML